MSDETAETAEESGDGIDSAATDEAAREERKALIRSLLELAEEPGLWLPGQPGLKVFQGNGFAFVGNGRAAYVHRLRLKGSEVEGALDRVATIMSLQEFTEATWWVGRLSRPRDLAERLVELGLEPDDPPRMMSLMIERKPGAPPEGDEAPEEAEAETPAGAEPAATGPEAGSAGSESDPESTETGSEDETGTEAAEQSGIELPEDFDPWAPAPEYEDDIEGDLGVRVETVATLDGLLTALEIDWECFGVDEAERAIRRGEVEEGWPRLSVDERISTYLAYVDDEPVGFARAIFTPKGVLMLGGATLPHARGRGVYQALVRARWRDAVNRKTPRLTVSAGPQSTPILRRLGFQPIGRVQLFRQRI